MKRFTFIFAVLIGVGAIGACSGDKSSREGPLAVQETQLGPVTEDLVKELPGGLVGDTANARYSSQPLRGEDDDGGV